MLYKIVVTEKPSVARDIAKVLGAKIKRNGYLEGNGYKITWCVGHLVSLCYPEDYDPKYKKWYLEVLPIIPDKMKTKVNDATKDQFKIISELINMEDSEQVICATDAGREGEYIFGLVYQKSKCKKPVKRLWISSMTDEAILDGFGKLKDGSEYRNLFLSAKCRSEADWLVGINATRLYSVLYKVFLSVGRVQTPTLAMIVNRHLEIVNFKPEKYFEIIGIFEGYAGLWTGPKGSKIKEEQKALDIIEKVKGRYGTVKNIEKKDKSTPNPLLYDLTELQRDANKYFGYSAQETLDIAQSLYETHKVITYPRTDCRYLSEDMVPTFKSLLEKIKNPRLSKYIDLILKNGINITKRIVDNNKISDHHAIIPTGKQPATLSDKELNLYDLITIRFVSVFLRKHEYQETIITTEVESELFISKGKTIIVMGWMEIESRKEKEPEIDKDSEESEQTLPILQVGQKVLLLDIKKLDKFTTPKKEHTESSLLSAMENAGRSIDDEVLKEQLKDKGLGTPATRSVIIEKLIKAEYIERKKKSLIPTDKGIKLIELIPENLKSAETTGEWEFKLNEIAKGKRDANTFMEEIKNLVLSIINSKEQKSTVTFNQKFNNSNIDKEVIGKCPRCGQNIYETPKAFSCEGYRNDPPCKFALWKDDKFFDIRGKKLTKTVAKQLLKNGAAKVKGFKSSTKNSTYDAEVILKDTGKYVNFLLNFNVGEAIQNEG